MSETLPLFPLSTVLYPGLRLPLRIFEDRYRRLVRDLRAGPQPGRFGVVAIRRGSEVGPDAAGELHQVGCVAVVRTIAEQPDGRFELATVGTRRFRLLGVDRSLPYLRGDLEFLPEEGGDEAGAAAAAQAVRAAFGGYLAALASRGVQVNVPDLPDEPVLLSYLVAASVVAHLADKQALLAVPDAHRRLRAELSLLARETAMLRVIPSAPAPQQYAPYSAN